MAKINKKSVIEFALTADNNKNFTLAELKEFVNLLESYNFNPEETIINFESDIMALEHVREFDNFDRVECGSHIPKMKENGEWESHYDAVVSLHDCPGE